MDKWDQYLAKLKAMSPAQRRKTLDWLRQNRAQLRDWIDNDLVSADTKYQDIYFQLADLEDETSSMQQTKDGSAGSEAVPRL